MDRESFVHVSLSPDGLARWLAVTVFVLLLWVGREILPPFVVAGVVAYMLSRPVDALAERARIRRGLAAGLVFLTVVVLLGLGVWLLNSRLAGEITALGVGGPELTRSLVDQLTGGQSVTIMGQQLTPDELSARLLEAASSEVAGLNGALDEVSLAVDATLRALLALGVLAYLLLDGGRFGSFLLRFVPHAHTDVVERIATDIHCVLGRYLRGQAFLVLLMSVLTFIGLEFGFHLRYALPIAIATGLLEVIPLIGPVSAAAIACAVGFVQGGPQTAGALALFYFVLRQLEDYLIMPRVLGGAVSVHPVVTIFAVLLGERVAGVLGMLLAVPCAAAVKVILDHVCPPHGIDAAARACFPPLRRASRLPAPVGLQGLSSSKQSDSLG